MTRFLALTLLIGFFAFLPSASADGENGLHITPADTRQTASNGAAMLTLKATNIQVRAKWRLDGDYPFAITDNGELRLTATLSDPTIIVATVIVEDMFSELNRNYQNLAATALITVEFISGTLRIVNPPARLLAASGMGGTIALQTSGGMGEQIFRLYSASDYFTLGETSGILSVAASVAVGQYAITVEVRDETATLFITVIAEVEAANTLILANAPPLAATVTADVALSLHTFTASGGLGTLTYALIGNHEEHFSIGERDGVLRTYGGVVEGIYTLMVEVADGTIIPQRATAMAAIEIIKLNTLTLKAKISDKSISLHAFAPHASAYSIVAGNDDGYFAIGEASGVLSVQAWTPVGNYPLNIGITYTFSLGIPPRVAVSAVVVEITDYPTPTQRKIYVLGGSSDSSSTLNDVWSSVGGKTWEEETANAAWSDRGAHQALSHNSKIYVLGGSDRSNLLNDVWSSADGQNWLQVTENAEWQRRDLHQVVSHNGHLYVLGGHSYYGLLPVTIATNDVWSSVDGKIWEEETAAADWSGRNSHQALSHNGRMYVLGGEDDNGDEINDVWSSVDGKIWVEETAAADWSARKYHQAVSHNGRLYVLGGEDHDDNETNDVWSSADGGKNWRQEKANNSVGWSARSYHQALSLNGRLYVLGGYDGNNTYNDVWSSADGKSWILETGNADWLKRAAHQAVVFPPSLAWLALPDTNEFTLPFGESVIIHTFEAQYGDGNYIYNLLSDISGFSLSANGELSTDGTAATGEHTITVQVADGDGQAITWTGKVIIISAAVLEESIDKPPPLQWVKMIKTPSTQNHSS